LNSKLTTREQVILILTAVATALVSGVVWMALGLDELLGPWFGPAFRGLSVGLGVFVVARVLVRRR